MKSVLSASDEEILEFLIRSSRFPWLLLYTEPVSYTHLTLPTIYSV